MRKAAGVAVVLLGIFLVIAGLDASDSLASRFSRFFTGSPTDRTIWLLIGGVVAVVIGVAMMSRYRTPPP
ncbi:MAG TPA: DUF3185 family protein [Planctomycetota bacterium]|nr:DUF3185 family protein [Planctomycetota bacterium]